MQLRQVNDYIGFILLKHYHLLLGSYLDKSGKSTEEASTFYQPIGKEFAGKLLSADF